MNNARSTKYHRLGLSAVLGLGVICLAAELRAEERQDTVKLLGSGADIHWDLTPAGLRITPPAELGKSRYAWSFEIVTDAEQHTPNVMVRDADAALKNTRRVDLEGRARPGRAGKN